LEEAEASSIGVETPLSPEIAVKIVILTLVSGMAISIAGLGLSAESIW
jgi:hypothetical protein